MTFSGAMLVCYKDSFLVPWHILLFFHENIFFEQIDHVRITFAEMMRQTSTHMYFKWNLAT